MTLPPSYADCLEIWEPNLLEPSGPVQGCNGIALPLPLLDGEEYHNIACWTSVMICIDLRLGFCFHPYVVLVLAVGIRQTAFVTCGLLTFQSLLVT